MACVDSVRDILVNLIPRDSKMQTAPGAMLVIKRIPHVLTIYLRDSIHTLPWTGLASAWTRTVVRSCETARHFQYFSCFFDEILKTKEFWKVDLRMRANIYKFLLLFLYPFYYPYYILLLYYCIIFPFDFRFNLIYDFYDLYYFIIVLFYIKLLHEW